MPDFVQAQISTDPTVLTNQGVDQINATLVVNGYTGWSPSDSDLAVIILQTVAQFAASTAQVAATVLPAIFRAFGTVLYGIAYTQGAYATVSSTWTFTSASPVGGYTIPAGAAVVIAGSAFYVQTAYTSNTGDTTALVLLVAAQPGITFNNLGTPGAAIAPNDQFNFVAGVTQVGTTAGGADPQSDTDYQNKLAATLQLQGPRPITATDYPTFLLSNLAQQQTGVIVGRATALDGYFPAPRALSTGGSGSTVLSCTTTNLSPTVTVVTVTSQVAHIGATVTGTGVPGGATVAATPAPTPTSFTMSANASVSATNNLTVGSMDGYGPTSLTCNATFGNASPTVTINTGPYLGAVPYVGATVTGTGIPAGTTVLGTPAPTATSFTMSQNSSSAQAGITVTVNQWSTVQLAVTSFVTDSSGNALTAASMDALGTWLQGYREVGALINVEPPSYSTVYVSVSVHILPGAVAATVTAAVQAALLAYLSPAQWGNTSITASASNWLNSGVGFNLIRLNKLIGVVENVYGVDYVPNGGLTLGFTASPVGTTDLTMTGPAPLPQSSVATIIVTSV